MLLNYQDHKRSQKKPTHLPGKPYRFSSDTRNIVTISFNAYLNSKQKFTLAIYKMSLVINKLYVLTIAITNDTSFEDDCYYQSGTSGVSIKQVKYIDASLYVRFKKSQLLQFHLEINISS